MVSLPQLSEHAGSVLLVQVVMDARMDWSGLLVAREPSSYYLGHKRDFTGRWAGPRVVPHEKLAGVTYGILAKHSNPKKH